MPSSSPAPRLVARSTVSFGMLLAAALSTASLNRGLVETSLPPSLAETVISRMRRGEIFPRLASGAALWCLMFAHLLGPAMTEISRCRRQELYAALRATSQVAPRAASQVAP